MPDVPPPGADVGVLAAGAPVVSNAYNPVMFFYKNGLYIILCAFSSENHKSHLQLDSNSLLSISW